MIVRTMQPNELDATLILFNYYRDEAVQTMPKIALEYDEDSVVETIRNFSIRHNTCWFNLYEGQRPVGFIAGGLVPCPWNKTIASAHIAFLFVLPSHRSIDSVKQLMNEFEAWAKNCKCSQITGGDIGINLERSKKLYNHLGFQEGVWMAKEIAE